MNARQAVELSNQLVSELFENAKSMSARNGKNISECIDHRVNFYVRKSKSSTEAVAWELRGEEAKKLM